MKSVGEWAVGYLAAVITIFFVMVVLHVLHGEADVGHALEYLVIALLAQKYKDDAFGVRA